MPTVGETEVKFNLRDEEVATMQKLAKKLDTTCSAILRTGLALLDFVETEKDLGGDIAVWHKDGGLYHIVMPKLKKTHTEG